MDDTLRKTLDECQQAARKGGQLAAENSRALQKIVQKSRVEFEKLQISIANRQNNGRLPDYCQVYLNEANITHNNLLELQEGVSRRLQQEMEKLTVFKLVVYGRTKAGKSTLMEVLTKGEGNSIGKGAQRTTVDVREYNWNGMTVFDTPGIAASAKEGREDEKKAYEAARYGDMLVFLFSDDAPQQEEANAFARLKQLDKPMLGIINCKSSSSDRKFSKMRLRDIKKKLTDERLDRIKEQFLQLASNGDGRWKDSQFVYTDLHTAFLSILKDPPELAEHSDELYSLSRFAKVEDAIVNIINRRGSFYQYKTFVDIIYCEACKIEQQLRAQCGQSKLLLTPMQEDEKRLRQLGQRFERDAKESISSFVQRLERHLKSLASSFAADNYENKHASEDWQNIFDREDVTGQVDRKMSELVADCEKRIEEFSQEFKQLLNIRLSGFNIGICGDTIFDFGSGLRIGASLVGIGLAIANCLNPIGLAVLTVVGLLSYFFESKEEKIRKQVNKMRDKLFEWIDKVVADIEGQMHNALQKQIMDNYMLRVYEDFHSMIDNIGQFYTLEDSLLKDLNHNLLLMNRQLLQAIAAHLHNQGLTSSIRRMARVPGQAIVLELASHAAINHQEVCTQIHDLLQDEVFILPYNCTPRQAITELLGQDMGNDLVETENKFWAIKAVNVQKFRMLACLPGIMRQLYDCDVIIQGEVAPPYTVADEAGEAQSQKQEQQADGIAAAETKTDEQAEILGQDVNSPDAQWEIALCYFYGDNVEQNDDEAFAWALKAADQREPAAQCFVGDCYYFGIGTEKDFPEAVNWYEIAAEAGYIPAYSYLGDCYLFGEGVQQSAEKAAEYYEKAAASHFAEAEFNLGCAFYFGEGKAQDYKKACEFFTRAASGHRPIAGAQNNLGNCYYTGKGVKQNFQKAYQLYEAAVANGSREARENMRNFYN